MLTEAAPRQGRGHAVPGEVRVSDGEIVTLAWADVDRDGRRITLRREHFKNGQPRVIPFVATLTEKTPGLRFHDLRSSAVRNLVAAGVDQAVAMRSRATRRPVCSSATGSWLTTTCGSSGPRPRTRRCRTAN
jgi:hypothetical protein